MNLLEYTVNTETTLFLSLSPFSFFPHQPNITEMLY